jgi:hypothetical protein
MSPVAKGSRERFSMGSNIVCKAGIDAFTRSAHDSLLRSITTRAQQVDDFLVALETQPDEAEPHSLPRFGSYSAAS